MLILVMDESGVMKSDILKVSGGTAFSSEDILAIEEPMEIQISYHDQDVIRTRKVSVTMRTPGNDTELGLGFLFTEGIIKAREDIVYTEEQNEENTVQFCFSRQAQPVLNNTERNFYTTSSCGVCGKSSIDAIKTTVVFERTRDNIRLHAELIYQLPGKLRQQQEIFDRTGGLHASAIFDLNGNFITLREDVGRHNALDKVIGAALLQGELPLMNIILLLSGRASFELIQKAAMAGIKVVAAVGAPSSLAVSLAAENGITLIGFLRERRFNVYTGSERIIIS